MTQYLQPASPTLDAGESDPRPRGSATLWRVAGALGIAYVVLTFAGISQEALLEHGASQSTVEKVYGGADLTRVLAGGYIESLAVIVLMIAVVVIARLLGRRTEAGRVAGQSFLALGTAFVASTLAVGFPAGAAAIYGSQHGADAHAVAMVNDVRNYAFFLQVALQAAMALALGIAALADRLLVKWAGWLGIAVGAAGIVAVPFGPNAVSMAWMIWWVGLSVLLLRGPRTVARTA